MSERRSNARVVAILGTVSMLLILSAYYALTESPSTAEMLWVAPTQTGATCEECDQEQSYVDNQAVATAEIIGDAAQATLNSVNVTLSAAQTQEQNNANFIAAQIAATAEIVRANAKATLVAADFDAERRVDPGCNPANSSAIQPAGECRHGDAECDSHGNPAK